MNIGEFKQAVRELRQALKQGEEAGSLVAQLGAPFETEVHEVGPSVFGDVLLRGDEEVLSLVAQLSALVQDLSDESPVYPELMVEVRLILDQYWAWVVKNVPCENWQKGEEVSPWLNLQRTLYQVKLLTNDYHHPVLYRALARQYLALGQSQLDVEKLLFMLMRCGRLMGYAEKGELSTYPLERLKTTIVDIERYRRACRTNAN